MTGNVPGLTIINEWEMPVKNKNGYEEGSRE